MKITPRIKRSIRVEFNADAIRDALDLPPDARLIASVTGMDAACDALVAAYEVIEEETVDVAK